MIARTLCVSIFVLTATVAIDPFLDCPGNEPSWWQYLVRLCCKNEAQLPNNCECFSIQSGSGYQNTRYQLPKCPKDLGVRFLLYTKNNGDSYQEIKASDSSVANSHFKTGKPVVFISHGFDDSAENAWEQAMKDAFFQNDKTEDANVILVDWTQGAKPAGLWYYTAAANVRTVGAMVAKLVTVLVDSYGVGYQDVHLIGHSLGAHVSGMAGKEVFRLKNKKIGRISGLDPAGLAFENYGTLVRLTKDDADFVDVIHTDGESLANGAFGIRIDVGTVDFKPNGGKNQPGCDGVVCSHMRVLDYYTNSITETCRYDTGGGCRMGHFAAKEFCLSGSVVLSTSGVSPYC